jgi:hypothetical protein
MKRPDMMLVVDKFHSNNKMFSSLLLAYHIRIQLTMMWRF